MKVWQPCITSGLKADWAFSYSSCPTSRRCVVTGDTANRVPGSVSTHIGHSTVFLCGTMPLLRHKLNRLKLFRKEPSTLFWISSVACRTCLCYLQLISLLWPLVERICPWNFSLKSQNPLFVLINFTLIQHSTPSFLGLGLEQFPRVFTRTKRYCAFIQYTLNHYQDSIAN